MVSLKLKSQNINEDVSLIRGLPKCSEAESGVIGAILLNPGILDDIQTEITEKDFLSPSFSIMYHCLSEMRCENKAIDLELFVEELRKCKMLEEVGGHASIAEIMCNTQVAAHGVFYAKIVKKYSKKRALLLAASEISEMAYQDELDTKELISYAEEKILSIGEDQTRDSIHDMNEVMSSVVESITASKDDTGTLLTGFDDLDKILGGLRPSELTIIAARPSMGKTALAANIAEYVAVDCNKPVLFVSLEMSMNEIGFRLLSGRAKVQGNMLRNNVLTEEQRKKVFDTAEEINKSPLFIDDSPVSNISDISSVARRIKRKHGLSLLIIDYIGLIEPDQRIVNRQEQVAKIARRLKGLSRELEIPVLCLSQLNRNPESTKDNRPRLSHLRESGAIEQDADVVMFVHRDEYYMSKEDAEDAGKIGMATIIVAKQRTGPTGDVDLKWKSEYTKFMNLDSPEKPEAEPFDDLNQFSSYEF